MKAIRAGIASAFLLLPLSGRAAPFWEAWGPSPQANGDGNGVSVSGRVSAIDWSSNYDGKGTPALYIGAAGGGVWRSTDYTSASPTWTPLTDSLGFPPEVANGVITVGCITVDVNHPQTIYVGTGEANYSGGSRYGAGILKSTDGGNSWTLLGADLFRWGTISRIIVDPTDVTGNTVYASASYSGVTNPGIAGLFYGVYKSTNGGITWTSKGVGIGLIPISDMEWDIGVTGRLVLYAAAGTPSGAGGNGVYRSLDGGDNWTLLTNGLPSGSGIGRIALAGDHRARANALYAVVITPSSAPTNKGNIQNVYVSTDRGSTWTTVTNPGNIMLTQGWYDLALAVGPDGSVYIGGFDIVRSTNGGTSWASIATGSNGVSPHVDHHALTFTGGAVYDGNDGGIFRWTPSNAQWESLNTAGLQTIQITGLTLHPSDTSTAIEGSQDNGTARRDSSTGPIWNTVAGGDGGWARFDPNDGNVAYRVMPQASSTNFFYRSDDGGKTWAAKTNTITSDTFPFYPVFAIDPGNTSRLVIGSSRVYETTDKADTWTSISGQLDIDPPPTNTVHNVSALVFDPTNGSVIYAGYDDGEVFKTTNNGSNWSQVANGSQWSSLAVTRIVVDPADATSVYITVQNFAGGRVWHSGDVGTTWKDISANLPHIPAYALVMDDRTDDPTLYVGMDLGVYRSMNYGASWEPFGFGLPDVQVSDLYINKNTNVMAAGTYGRGAFIHPIGDLYVDRNAAGGGNGSQSAPFNTVGAGISATTYPQEVVFIRAGNYPEILHIAQPCRLDNWGHTGIARIGAQ